MITIARGDKTGKVIGELGRRTEKKDDIRHFGKCLLNLGVLEGRVSRRGTYKIGKALLDEAGEGIRGTKSLERIQSASRLLI